jgi:hypothetical protein
MPAPQVGAAPGASAPAAVLFPDQAAAGSIGGASGGLAAVLDSPRLAAGADVRAFLSSGAADPRMVSVLNSALANHTIGVSAVMSLSDPVHVQSIDIVSVDGQPVGADNFAARDLVTEIAAMDPSLRPSEIGTPWPIHSPGFYSDPASVGRLHLAFEMPGTGSGAEPAAGAGAAYPPAASAVYPDGVGAPSAPGAAAMPAAAPGAAATPAAAAAAIAGVAQAPVAAGATPVGVASPFAGVVQAALGAPPAGAGAGAAMEGVAAASPGVAAAAAAPHGPAAVLAYAHAMLGKLPESAGDNLGPALDKFEAEFGFHGAAWCGIFAGHALEAAGLKVPHSVASVAAILQMAQDGSGPFKQGILPISAAQPGDLATFGGAEHVAIITKVDAAGVHTIAGNTSQENVSETIYPPGAVTGVVRPDYAAGTVSQLSDFDRSLAGNFEPAAAAAGVGATPGAAADAVAGTSGAAPGGVNVAAAAGTPGQAAAAAAAPGQPAMAAAAQAAAEPPQAGTSEFAAIGRQPHGAHRATVQFLQAVRPQPGSPLAAQPGVAAPGAAAVGSGAAPAAPGAAAAVAQPGTAGASGQAPAGLSPDQAGGQGPGLVPEGSGTGISVSSSLLTPGQSKFAGRLAELTGLDPHVVAAWELAEESGGAAQGREAASNFNWLNIGYFDSGAGKMAFDKAFSDPISAAEQSAKFLKGEWGGASSSIRAILASVGQSPEQQLQAIANSDWASTHYRGGADLRGTFDELKDIQVRRSPGGA